MFFAILSFVFTAIAVPMLVANAKHTYVLKPAKFDFATFLNKLLSNNSLASLLPFNVAKLSSRMVRRKAAKLNFKLQCLDY